jgi:hypothetical protein
MTLTEIPAGVSLPKTAEPARSEVISQIDHNGNRLVIVYRGSRNVPKRRSATTWAKTLVSKPYMRVVTYESYLDEHGNHLRWRTVGRVTVDVQ